MRRLKAKIKYLKLSILILTFILAYTIFYTGKQLSFQEDITSFGYIGTFLSGIFFAYGFTAAPATAILLVMSKWQNIIIAGIAGGLGALAGDFIIFKFIRHSMMGETEMLKMRFFPGSVQHPFLRKYVIPILAGFIIASPLPDEIGVSMLAASRIISTRVFAVISFLLNTAGIFVILLVGSTI